MADTSGFSLTQMAEVNRGAAVAVLRKTVTLAERLGLFSDTKQTDPSAPERSNSGAHPILGNAYDDLMRAESMLDTILDHIGQVGVGPEPAETRNPGHHETADRPLAVRR